MRIVILSDFTGYPDGQKRRFTKGERPADLDAAYARLLVAKKLARKLAAKEKPGAAK
jgi:hypothetical protein